MKSWKETRQIVLDEKYAFKLGPTSLGSQLVNVLVREDAADWRSHMLQEPVLPCYSSTANIPIRFVTEIKVMS